ncbi:MAG: DUF6173 family protein [Gammaproteobacteria bacterium]
MNPDDLKRKLFGDTERAAEAIGAAALNLRMPDLYAPLMPPIPDSQLNPAKWAYERLGEYIKDFEDGLDEEHEIGARLVAFGPSVVFHIQELGYYGPDIVSFDGVNEKGERVQLVQHISQLNVLLVAVKKLGQKPKRIGFVTEDDKESGA